MFFMLVWLCVAGFGFRRQDAPHPNPALDAALIEAIEKKSKQSPDSMMLPTETPEEIAEVKRLLEAGASPNALVSPANKNFYSPNAKVQRCALILSAGWNHLEVVRLLVAHGANVNVRDEWGGTALLYCSDVKETPLARYLIEHGADVNAQQNDGLTPLAWAVMNRNLDYLRYLLEHGANPNVHEKRGGLTPLMSAASYGELEAAKLLLAHGADPGFVTDSGATAMFVAKTRGNDDVLKLLLAAHPKMSLHEAARVGDVEAVRALLDAGEKVDLPDKYGNPPIFGAVLQGCLETTRLLIERGANVNAFMMRNRGSASNGQAPQREPMSTLLTIAAARDYPDMVNLLLAKGANLNAAVKLGRIIQMPMTAAVQAGNLEVVKILLRHNPDLTAHRQGGRALAAAIQFASYPRDLRLKRGKRPVKGHDSRQEDAQARNAILELMLKLPLNYKKDGGFAVCATADREEESLPFLKTLIQRGANVNFVGDEGKTPLISAIQWQHYATIRLLLAKGANVNATVSGGITPLRCTNGDKKIIALLKRAGAKE